MKTLEVIEPLTSAESTEYESSKFEIASTQKHVERWVKAVIRIRDGRLYRIEFGTWEEFCEQMLNKTARSVHMAIQAEAVRQEIGSTASDLSDRAALALKNVEPKKRKAVVAKAKRQGGEGPLGIFASLPAVWHPDVKNSMGERYRYPDLGVVVSQAVEAYLAEQEGK